MGAWAVFITQTLFFISGLLNLYFWVVIIAAVMTWIEPNPYNPIVRFLYSVTEPVFEWIREHLPVVFGGIDFSPLVVIFGIQIIQQVLLPTLRQALIGQPFRDYGPIPHWLRTDSDFATIEVVARPGSQRRSETKVKARRFR